MTTQNTLPPSLKQKTAFVLPNGKTVTLDGTSYIPRAVPIKVNGVVYYRSSVSTDISEDGTTATTTVLLKDEMLLNE